ncbi:MAG TPA: RelA/SpoT domain-containing protein [Phycisphaerae bacterium]|jgi:ppGpp synthetase/RelA/SpoT-type nucleotidyltranferase|nr:RelA/SpoT domain-containing protein [Phycisphaerae bacterium]
MGEFSKAEVDRLGERLRAGAHAEGDLRMLDEYRGSFRGAYESVLEAIRRRSEAPTGRIAKSTHSIVEKLQREKMRLSRMQDIAGCRVVVVDVLAQDRLVTALQGDFVGARIRDRREKPSHGYRAVHLIVEVCGKLVEIQVRSELQHLWAELSEKSADVLDPAIKYGGGSESWRTFLNQASAVVAAHEELERMRPDREELEVLRGGIARLLSHEILSLDKQKESGR